MARNRIRGIIFPSQDSTGAAADVLKKGGVVLMVWEHSNIPPLVRSLGVPNVPVWNGKDFDSIWIIEYSVSKKGHLKFKSFTIGQENIFPAPVCK